MAQQGLFSIWTSSGQLEAVLWGIGSALGELPPYFISRADEGAVGADEGAVGGEAMTGTDTESTEPEAVADEISLVESIRVDEPIGPGALAGEPDLMRSLPPLLHKKQRSKKEPRSQNLLRNVLADEGAVRGEAESATNTDVPTGPGSIAGEIDLLGSLPPLLHKKQRSKIPPGEPKECKESIPDEGAVRGEAESATNTDVPTGPGAIAGEIDLMGSLPPLLHKKQRSKKPPLEPKECKESSQNFPPNVHANEGVVAAANTDEPTDPGVVAASNTNEATGPGAVTETSTDGLVMLALAAAELAGPVGEAVAGTNTDEPTGSGAVAETNADIERLVMLAAVASGLTGPGGATTTDEPIRGAETRSRSKGNKVNCGRERKEAAKMINRE